MPEVKAPPEKPPRTLRLVVQMVVIEPLPTNFSDPKELTWSQRQLVVPIDRVKAFDFNEIAEGLIHDAIESTAE